jgi:hypothetical protein
MTIMNNKMVSLKASDILSSKLTLKSKVNSKEPNTEKSVNIRKGMKPSSTSDHEYSLVSYWKIPEKQFSWLWNINRQLWMTLPEKLLAKTKRQDKQGFISLCTDHIS